MSLLACFELPVLSCLAVMFLLIEPGLAVALLLLINIVLRKRNNVVIMSNRNNIRTVPRIFLIIQFDIVMFLLLILAAYAYT